jgi:hypothetical protein
MTALEQYRVLCSVARRCAPCGTTRSNRFPRPKGLSVRGGSVSARPGPDRHPLRVPATAQCPAQPVMSCPLRTVLRDTLMSVTARRLFAALICIRLQRTFYFSKNNSSLWLRKTWPPPLRGLRFAMWHNGSPDLRGFGAGVAKLRSAEKSRKCADVSRSRPHLRMQSGDPMWRRMAPHRFGYCRSGGVLAQMFNRCTTVRLSTKVS